MPAGISRVPNPLAQSNDNQAFASVWTNAQHELSWEGHARPEEGLNANLRGLARTTRIN